MTKATIAGGAAAVALLLVAFAVGYRVLERGAERAATAPLESGPSTAAAGDPQGYLYGRVTTGGAVYEGRLRWGGDEEAFWGDYFNGEKAGNPWAAHVPPERLRAESSAIELFGLEIGRRERQIDLDRLLMARFGDLARLEARGRDVRVTLKSGSAFDLDRLEASDFDDGVRVWDAARGVVDLDSGRIRTIELLPAATPGDAAARLHGTVRTPGGEFTGFLQWNREACVGSDELVGRGAEGWLALRFDTIRAIERAGDGTRVTLVDGREIALAGDEEVGPGDRGTYVDDPRYGRVLVAWEAIERIDFGDAGAAGSGPGYDDFPPGQRLAGGVTTRDGRRLAGRLVFDLDESETTETLDAPAEGVNYTIPFGLVAAIALPSNETDAGRARVTLHGGEEFALELAGDLGGRNAGLLVFADAGEHPEYVPWSDVERIDLERPPAMYPSLDGR